MEEALEILAQVLGQKVEEWPTWAESVLPYDNEQLTATTAMLSALHYSTERSDLPFSEPVVVRSACLVFILVWYFIQNYTVDD